MLAFILDAVGFICGAALYVFIGLLPFPEKVKEHKKALAALICSASLAGAAVFAALSGRFGGGWRCIIFTVAVMLAFSAAKIRILRLDFKKVYWVECVCVAGVALMHGEGIGVSRLLFGYGGKGCFEAGYFVTVVPAAVICVALVIPLMRRLNHYASRHPSMVKTPAFTALLLLLSAGSVAGSAFALQNASFESCINEIMLFFAAYAGLRLWCASFADRLLAASAAARNEQLERIIDIQRLQYSSINDQIAQTKKACHDLRHHMSAIKQLVSDREYESLYNYLTAYGKSLPDVIDDKKCGNAAVDSVIKFYCTLAAEKNVGTDFDFQSIGNDCGISTPDLCIVLGNALENAVEAAASAGEETRFVRVRCENTDGWITIVVGNGFSVLPREENGVLMSSKRVGRAGIGTESIKAVAEKYNGSASFEVKGNLFRTSVILFK